MIDLFSLCSSDDYKMNTRYGLKKLRVNRYLSIKW